MVAAASATAFVDGSAWMSFSQLVEACAGARQLERRPCTPLTSRVVVWAAARKLGAGPFGSFVHEPAFARAALDLILDLKAGGLTPQGFREAVDRFPATRIDRARYLARLYEEYESQLETLKLADREDGLRGALAAVRQKGLPLAVRKFSAVSVEGIYDFPWSRRELLFELAQQCERAGITFQLKVPGGCSAEVDGVVDPVLSEFERRAQTLTHVEIEKEDLTVEGRPLAWLGRHLFTATPNPDVPADVPLDLVRTATSRHEVQVLARVVLKHIENGVAPERIAVAWPDLGEEAEWMVEALEALGVPARIRRGMPLDQTAPGRVALELPLIVDDGFPAEDVARLLASRYLPEVSNRAPDSPATLLALASVRDNELGAEDGRGAYEVRLQSLLRRIEDRSKTRSAQVRALWTCCQKLIQVAGQIPAEAKAGELLERWWNALDELGLVKAVRQPEPRGAEGTALGRAVLRALARDQAAFEALNAMTQELRAALKHSGAASTRMPRRTFQRWLLDAALDFNLAPRGPRGGAVHVLDIRELGGRHFDAVCLGGLTDGRFPGRDTPHPLFPEEDRVRVNAWHKRDVFRLATGEGERRIPWRLAADRLTLHLALSSTVGEATLSHATEASGGAEQMASPFWDEVVRLTGRTPRTEPLRSVPLLSDVRTEAQLRERTALELFSPPELRTSDPDPAAGALNGKLGEEPWLVQARHLAEVESERLRFFGTDTLPPGPWSGSAHRPDLGEALAACFQFDRDRPLSASLLQKFGNCAFQGFLAYAVRLEEPEEPGEEIDARGQGSFWHKVLEELFPRLKEKALLGAAVDDVPDSVIDEALDRAAQSAEQTGHTGHPALWRLGRERARRMVRRVLSDEHRGLPFHFMEPSETELHFGREGAPEAWREVSVPGVDGEPPIFVEGKIDRIDQGNGGLGVVDYKSGGVSTGKAFLEALLVTEYQLPLYLYAARTAGHRGALKAAWLKLKDGEPVDLEAQLHKHQLTLDDLLTTDPDRRAELEKEGLKNLVTAVQRLVSGLRKGQFPARPEDCGFCAYQRVCRISERRLPEGSA